MIFIKAISKLPMNVLYILSDGIFILMYYVLRYRKKIVLDNLRQAFPEKDSQQINLIAKQFYHRFSDTIIEIVKGISISSKELNRRIKLRNNDLSISFLTDAKSIIISTSHSFNWEWALLWWGGQYPGFQVNALYTPLSNPFFESLLLKIRSRFGGILTKREDISNYIFKNRNIPKVLVIMADQVPQTEFDSLYWAKFLNRNTAFFLGVERIAKVLDYPVYYMKMTCIRRGYYLIDLLKIADPPYEKSSHAIIENYICILENHILGDPANWLWSHRRWKFTKISTE